ncbi:hypothetical protein Droror1_Dr00021377 [Drosera rotundifolia]
MELNLLIICILACVISTSSSPILCHDIERSALLSFKQSFSIDFFASIDPSSYPKTLSWKPTGDGSDCCEWDGVECQEHTGHVLSLDLSSSCLYGSLPSNSTLFELVHLQALNLADNDFRYSPIPSKLGHLVNLRYLNLSQSRLYGQVPIEVSTLSNLISLDLSLNLEPPSGFQLLTLQHPNLATLVKNLTALEVLRLSEVNISSPFPEIIANLTSLRCLRLVNCGLHGLFPEDVFLLPGLQVLSLDENTYLSGYFPEFQSTSKLSLLSVENTGFYGRLPTSIGNLQSLEILDLSTCNFEGLIPASLGQLSQLIYLDLSSNSLFGEIPLSLYNLTQLSYLDLSQCNFQGYLSNAIGKLSHLTLLSLSRNSWISEIPPTLSNLTQLSYLEINHCNLGGDVPNFTNLTNLIYLNLAYNRLTGSITSFISGLPNLGLLFLDENNFTGPLDFDIFVRHQNLQALSLSKIDIVFPTNTHNISYYPQLVLLDLHTCDLNRLPDFIHNQTRLSVLNLRSNKIKGSLPIPSPSLISFELQGNGFRGEIPEAFCNATSLKVLDLQVNRLSGEIPPCLFNLSNRLELLDLEHNDLHGTIPEAFTSSCQLIWLALGSNRIEGALPRSLANCSFLETLALESNSIVDTFPIWLSGLPGLQALTLKSNKLHGPLPPKFGVGFPSLYSIDLSDNQFTGNMSDELFDDLYAMQKLRLQPSEVEVPFRLLGGEITVEYSLSRANANASNGIQLVSTYPMISVDLSKNRLVGKVPDSIRNLIGLQYLDLSYNNLTGDIPFSFSDLAQLQSLDLSHNRLSGEIPQGLTQLSFLSQLDVSYNQLTGPIPQDGQFSTFNNDSFIGNAGLCGSPLSKKCGNPEVRASSPNESSSKEDDDSTDVIGWVIRSMGYISGLVVGVVIGRMISDENHDWFVETFGRRQHKKTKKKKQRGIR